LKELPNMPEVPSLNGPGAQPGAAEEANLIRWTVAMPRARAALIAAATVATICSAIAVFSSLYFAPAPVPGAEVHLDGGPLVRAWARWDSGWYASIARDGYTYAPGTQGPVAFFPGYPLAIRTLAGLGLDRFTAGFLVTLLCGIFASRLFLRWATLQTDPKTAFAATMMLILYPFAFYLYGAIYSDALLLMLVIGAFLCLERDALMLATLLGAAATFTRPVAPAVVLGLLVRQIERRRQKGEPIRWQDFLPLLALGGIGLYMLHLWTHFGDPLAFLHVQSAPGWDQPSGWHTWLKITWFQILFPKVAPLVAFRLVGHAVVALGALALVPATRRHLGLGYAVYSALAVGLPTIASKDFMGLGRYVLSAFPLFLTLALLLRGKTWVLAGWLVLSALLLAVLVFAWGAGGYVA
jgi:hypothetical protein